MLKKILTITLALALSGQVFAYTNLWEYFIESYGYFPSIGDRESLAEECGISGYVGSAFQNEKFLDCLAINSAQENNGESLLGASSVLPTTVAFFETSLQSGISSSATSMTLISNTDKGGSTLASSTYAFVLDEGTASEEMVIADCFVAGALTCSNMTRGLSVTGGTTTVSALQKAHRRGASVKITDGPVLLILQRIISGVQNAPNIITYNSAPTFTPGSNQLASVLYVGTVASQGAATSSETSGGLVELGTLAEQASSFDGGVNQPTILQTKNSTSTCQVVGSYNIVASSTSGKLDKNCFDQTLNYTFTGTTTLATTTTIGSGARGGLIPPGSITAYATGTPPAGWLLTDGTQYPTASYPELFSVIGYSYGGSGANFNVPDIRGRNILMASTTANIKQTGGESNHTLTVAELAAHTHTMGGNFNQTLPGGGSGTFSNNTTGQTTGSAGSDTPFNVLDPYFVLQYIIKY